ncbi:TPA: SNF2-related protein [Streptococcus suis]
MEKIQERLRSHRPEDMALKREFLTFQAQHFNLKWNEVLQAFSTRTTSSLEPVFGDFTSEQFDRYIEVDGYPAGMDLSSYVTSFGQRGMANMTSLNDFEKNAVIDLAKYHLATYFQLIDELGNFKGINLDRILQQTENMNLINIAKVASNLANRIRTDYSETLSKDVVEPVVEVVDNLTYLETSSNGVDFYVGQAGMEARVDGQRVAFLASGKNTSDIQRETTYQNLAFLKKYDIIQRMSSYIAEQEQEITGVQNALVSKEVSAKKFTEVLDTVYVNRDAELVKESNPLKFKAATMAWSEASSDTDVVFTKLQDLQDYLTTHFVRTKEEYEDFVEGGGEHHYYDKTKIHFDFENEYGEQFRLTERVDMGLSQNDFNPYLETISDYLLSGRESDFNEYNLSVEDFQTLQLPRHSFPPEVCKLFQDEIEGNGIVNFESEFETIFEAYQYGSQSLSFKEQFPSLTAYSTYLSKPYDFSSRETAEKQLQEIKREAGKILLDKVKKELRLGQMVFILENGPLFNRERPIVSIEEVDGKVEIGLGNRQGIYTVTINRLDDILGGVISPVQPIEIDYSWLEDYLNDRINLLVSEDYYLWHWQTLLDNEADQEIIDEFHNSLPDFSFELAGLALDDSVNRGVSGFLSLDGYSIDKDSIENWLIEHSDGTFIGKYEAFNLLEKELNQAWERVQNTYNLQLEEILSKYQLGEKAEELQTFQEKPIQTQQSGDVELLELRELFPKNSMANYSGSAYYVLGVSRESDRRLRVELERNDGMLEDNRVIYSWNAEELRAVLSPVIKVLEQESNQVSDSKLQEPENTENITLQDFVFPEDLSGFYPQTRKEKVVANIEAIRLVKDLDSRNAQATAEEQVILAKYVGWGGLANDFFDDYNTRFIKEREILKNLVTPAEYTAMKESSLTAYYTDPAIIRQMWKRLIDDGFTGGRVLDPSMGTGNFFASMPREVWEKSELYGVELDSITGSIARQLHPNANIQIKGFEETDFNDGAFDLVLSNIPFANVRIADNRYDKPYLIHDYFIKRSMDLVRDGGQVSVISSTGTLDKRTGNILKDIRETSQFLGGVRLPDTAFRKIAGTTVTTDILFFQKDENKAIHGEKKPFSLVFEPSMPLPQDNRVWLNPFFGRVSQEFNPFILGEFEVRNFQGGTLSVKATSDNLIEELSAAMEQFSPSLPIVVSDLPAVENVRLQQLGIPDGLTEDMPLYSFAYVGDTVYYRDSTTIRVGTRVEDISYYVDGFGNFKDWADSPSKRLKEQFKELGVTDDTALDVYQSKDPAQRGKNKGFFKKTVFFENPLTDREIERIKGMVDLRDTYQSLIDIQRHHGYDQLAFEQLLTQLNSQYDSFLKKNGYLNSTVNRNLFDSDDRYSLLASLEDEYINDDTKKVEYKKSLAFERALIRPERIFKEVSSAKDALNTSIAEGRGVDFDFMKSLYKGKTNLDMIEELGDAVIPNPRAFGEQKAATAVQYFPRNQFLSGDVVSRMEEVDALIATGETSHDWERYKEMLQEVRPERITLTDIDYKIGSRWIPDRVYAYFASLTFTQNSIESFDDDGLDYILRTNSLDNKLEYVPFGSGGLSYSSAQDIQLGLRNSRHDLGRKIFLNLLNSNQATITMKIEEDGKERTVTDIEKTAMLRAKEAEIQELFKEFVDKRPEIQKVIEDSYNDLYNRTVTREYDGSHLEIDGLASNIELRPHQKNAIQRIVEERRALLAHEVGSGKTLTMLGAGFKMKELGMINKPLYVVPSSLTAQFGQEILKFFPTKNVFVTTKKDFIKSNRKQFISRIITGDYDAIVIGDSQFEKIPMSKERQEIYLEDKLEELRQMKLLSNDKTTVKQIEQSIKGFKEQLQNLQDISQDSFIEFENLGIDCLFVDEAHHFKNIRPVTNLGNVAGITNRTSKKNVDMEMKVRQIQSEQDNLGIIFATGTPVSNSISEIFTMMNYVQPDVLERYKVDHFDAWVGAFGQIENSMELSPTGDKYQPKKRFKKFTNLPELMKIYKETTDIQTSDMLNLPVPEAKIIPVESELTDSQRDYLADLVERTDKIKSGAVEPTEDNMLKITSEARKLAIDMRLLDNGYDLGDNNKMMQVVDNVERIYYEGDENKATQMIFSDIGTPKAGSFDIYNELRNLLIERGIPAQEIAFVHDANTDEKKNTLSRKVNVGEVRILLASTEKGGTGLNVQRKMKAVHHLDVPWRPSDLTQRNGRIIRQGNENKNVEIYHYITKGSFDNFLWETQEKKLKYITQIMTSKDPVRSAEDIDEQTMTASDFKALATGNPYLRKKMELENRLNVLENQRRAFNRSIDSAKETLAIVSQKLPYLETKLPRFEQDMTRANQSKGSDFQMVLGGQLYDKREDAGHRLHELLESNISDNKELRTLGTYRGFELKAMTQERTAAIYDFGDLLIKPTYTLQVVGENQYPVSLDLESAVGSMRRIDNAIDGIAKEINKTEQLINNYQTNAEAAEATLAKVFPMEEYQRVKEQYELIAPLIEEGASVEKIESAIRDYMDKQPQIANDTVSKDLEL